MVLPVRRSGIVILLAFLTAAVSCKKETPLACAVQPPCNTLTEIKGRTITDANYSVNLSLLAAEPGFADTLARHPQLEPLRTIADSSLFILHCRIFYKDLIVFTDYYGLFRNKRDNTWSGYGTIPDTIGISLTPTLTPEAALAIARQRQCYGDNCPSYRLGIYNVYAGNSGMPKDYRLVWNITGSSGYPTVMVDARDGAVYYSDDGAQE